MLFLPKTASDIEQPAPAQLRSDHADRTAASVERRGDEMHDRLRRMGGCRRFGRTARRLCAALGEDRRPFLDLREPVAIADARALRRAFGSGQHLAVLVCHGDPFEIGVRTLQVVETPAKRLPVFVAEVSGHDCGQRAHRLQSKRELEIEFGGNALCCPFQFPAALVEQVGTYDVVDPGNRNQRHDERQCEHQPPSRGCQAAAGVEMTRE